MKIYSIGRDTTCNIVIDDNTDVISRRHAVLSVAPSGKMTIMDQSHNGTYVNGIRIASNVPVPVTRKDNVSFAHIARLDWNLVPRPISPLVWVGAAVGALILIAAIVFGIRALSGGDGGNTGNQGQQTVVQKPDSLKEIVLTPEQVRKQQDSLREALTKEIQDTIRKKEVEDSLAKEKEKAVAKAKDDSIAKVKADSIAKVNKQKCRYCGKPISQCPSKGKKHEVIKPKTEKKDTIKRFGSKRF